MLHLVSYIVLRGGAAVAVRRCHCPHMILLTKKLIWKCISYGFQINFFLINKTGQHSSVIQTVYFRVALQEEKFQLAQNHELQTKVNFLTEVVHY